MTVLDCMTWNLHRCRGRDGVIDPDRTTRRVVDLLLSDPVDVLVLTEADEEAPPYGGLLDVATIRRKTGLVTAHGAPELRWGSRSHGFLGTVVLHSERLTVEHGHLLDLPGHYPRGAVILRMATGTLAFHLVATHLSLFQPLRIAQMRAVAQYLARREPLPTLLIGDLNEWRPWGGIALSPRVAGRPFRGPPRASFPASLPLLPLDRVMAAPPFAVTEVHALATEAARDTSDHLPLRARVALR
ncbi:MAG: endonuclease/exonuclease/phosphatase family protein [Pseudomonadota bacterium]